MGPGMLAVGACRAALAVGPQPLVLLDKKQAAILLLPLLTTRYAYTRNFKVALVP